MSRKALIKRLKWYYPLERLHAFISLLPIIFIIQIYIMYDSDINYKLLIWGGMAGLFGALEHINYYYKQLMVDTFADLKYIFKNGKLKYGSLAKDLRENEI